MSFGNMQVTSFLTVGELEISRSAKAVSFNAHTILEDYFF